MGRTITIEPVTRIEGHAKVTVHLDDAGKVEKARFHVNEFRGFEKFCEGRLFFEMPLITERICGICPVSHHLVSAKACDQVLGVDAAAAGQAPPRADAHGPDHPVALDALLRTGRARPAAGLRRRPGHPQRRRHRTRRTRSWRSRRSGCASSGRRSSRALGDRRIHPNFAVPGGVNKALAPSDRDAILHDIRRHARLRPGRHRRHEGLDGQACKGDGILRVLPDRLPQHGRRQ